MTITIVRSDYDPRALDRGVWPGTDDPTAWDLLQLRDGGWQVVVGGRLMGVEHSSFDAALAALVPVWGWPGGYTALYYPTDERGEVSSGPVCAHCVRSLITDLRGDDYGQLGDVSATETGFHVDVDDGDLSYYGSVSCDWCGSEILEHTCAECGDPVDPVGLNFYHADGYVLHASCLAPLVADGRATHIGKRTYRVHDTRSWAQGTYVSRGVH